VYSLLESLRSALSSIWAHRMRSFLTALGIIIGVASVVAVVSIVQGLSHSINDKFKGLGTNGITISSYTPFKDRLQGKFAKLTNADLIAIRHGVAGISHVTPIVPVMGNFGGAVKYRSQSTTTRVFGTSSSYQDLNSNYPRLGRFFTRSDDVSHRRVCVIGEEVRKDLHLPENPVGKFIQIAGEWLKVIGVMEPRGELLGFNQDDYVLLPYGTALSILGAAREPNIQVQLVVNNLNRMDLVREQITQILRNRHGLHGDQPDDFKVRTPEQLMDSVNQITGTVTLVLGGIVGISLLVGGVGIMNIMLVSVTERTREIGILKALGAKRTDILMQFLIEALVLCLIGGLIGLAAGFGIGMLAARLLPGFPTAFVPWWAVALAFGFSAGVGVVFGILPAAKAANLDPIEALRYE
jgi:putative ABC transport system permease protein